MKLIQRASYRTRQFWQALGARPLPEEGWSEIRSLLSPEELELYKRQSRSDRYHAYRVMRTLRAAEYNERDLLAAALLHDVGKSFCKTYWWDRPLVVICQVMAPRLSASLAKGEVGSWRRPFVVKERHADWGADAAEKAGSSPATVALIRMHQDRPCRHKDDRLKRLLARLQWADDSN